MKNKIEDLRNHLFDTIEKLKDGDMELETAKAVTNAAQTIVNSVKVEVDFIKVLGGAGEGTGFIPLDARKPNGEPLGEDE
ncbi:MAG: hypothetical protein KAR19_03650 [Bacteroidales bacterium]|nr:hypothetical protein [Bacteroidales bacterium]